MISHREVPSLDTFLAAPNDEVAQVAPRTIILAAGGTRRGAMLAGSTSSEDDYVHYSRERLFSTLELIFADGINHILTFAIAPTQFAETTPGYREKLIEWVDWGLAGESALAHYATKGWRVRLLGTEEVGALQPTADRLERETVDESERTIWWHVIPDQEAPWRSIFRAIHESGAQTREEATVALYGEAIPPATLFLTFGKPFVSPVFCPPLLVGKLHSYWSQRPTYEMDKSQWRTILYDFAFTRRTWQQNKQGRAESALSHRAAWENGPVLGVGMRLGPFWYPQPFSFPDLE